MTPTSRARRLASHIAILLAVHGVSMTAGATPEDEKRAAESFRQAEAAFARKDYAAAAAAFEQAASFAPHPSAWLNAAEAWDLGGEPVRAANACARALALPNVEARYQDEADRRLRALAPKVGRIEIAGPAKMRVRVDGGDELAPPADRWVAPGSHRIAVRDPEDGTSFSFDLEVGATETKRVDATPKPKKVVVDPPTTPPPPTPERSVPLPPLGAWVAFSAAAGAGIAVAVLGGLTVAAQSTFEDEPTRDNADKFYDVRLATNVCIGVAGGAALVGAIVWVIDAVTTTPPKSASAPRVSSSAGGTSLVVPF